MRCLAFDMATRAGWAAGDLSAEPVFGSELLGLPGSKHGARFKQALITVQGLAKEHKPQVIALEAAIAAGAAGGQERSQLAMGYRAIVHMVAFQAGVPVTEHHIGTIRKHFIKNGGVGGEKAKAMTMEQCIDLGWMVTDDNEADALAVWSLEGHKRKIRRTRVFGGLPGI